MESFPVDAREGDGGDLPRESSAYRRLRAVYLKGQGAGSPESGFDPDENAERAVDGVAGEAQKLAAEEDPQTAGDAALAAMLAREEEQINEQMNDYGTGTSAHQSGGARSGVNARCKPGQKLPGPDSLEGPIQVAAIVSHSEKSALHQRSRGSYYPTGTGASHLDLQSGSEAGRKAQEKNTDMRNGGPEMVTLKTKTNNVYAYDVSPAANKFFDMRAGCRVSISAGDSDAGTVVGICDSHVWFWIDGDSGSSFWRGDYCAVDVRDRGIELMSDDGKLVYQNVDDDWSVPQLEHRTKSFDYWSHSAWNNPAHGAAGAAAMAAHGVGAGRVPESIMIPVTIALENDITHSSPLLAIANILCLRRSIIIRANAEGVVAAEELVKVVTAQLNSQKPKSAALGGADAAMIARMAGESDMAARLSLRFPDSSTGDVWTALEKFSFDEVKAEKELAATFSAAPGTKSAEETARENTEASGPGDTPRKTLEERIDQAIASLAGFADGTFEADPRFDAVDSFEKSPELDVFELLGIPLLHGLVVNPDLEPEVAAAISGKSLRQTQAALRMGAGGGSEDGGGAGLGASQDVALDPFETYEANLVQTWLDENKSDMTDTGLAHLRQGHPGPLDDSEGHLGVLFRDGKFLVATSDVDTRGDGAKDTTGRFFTLNTDADLQKKKFQVWDEVLTPQANTVVDSAFVAHDDARRQEAVETAKLFGWVQYEIDSGLRHLEKPGQSVDTDTLTAYLQKRYPLRDQGAW